MEDSDWTDIPCSNDMILQYNDPCGDVKNVEEKVVILDSEDTATNDAEYSNVRTQNQVVKEKESCPICLSNFEDRSFLDQCFHSFCFCCILQWCEIVQTCPLCKSEFASLIHNVSSMQDYEQHFVENKNDEKNKVAEQNDTEIIYDYNGYDRYGNRFRYRTTSHASSNSTTVRNGEAMSASSSNFLQMHQLRRRQRRQRRQRWGEERTSRYRKEKYKGLEKRRQVYSYKIKAINSSESNKKYRNISSEFFKSNQACTHRLIGWLMRDLRVLLGNNEEEINFLMEFVLTLITRIDMESVNFIEELRPFLLDTTDHFVHELVMFAKSPFDLIAYDENVIYPWPSENALESTTERVSGSNAQQGGSLNVALQTTSSSAWDDTPVIIPHTTEDNTRLACDHTPTNISQNTEEVGRSTLNITPDISLQDGEVLCNTGVSHQRLIGTNEGQENRNNGTLPHSSNDQFADNKLEQTLNSSDSKKHKNKHKHRRKRKHSSKDENRKNNSRRAYDYHSDDYSDNHSSDYKKHEHKPHRKRKDKSKYKTIDNSTLLSDHHSDNGGLDSKKNKHGHRRKRKHRCEDKDKKDKSTELSDIPFNNHSDDRLQGNASPTIESMMEEIRELDVLIEKREQQLQTLIT